MLSLEDTAWGGEGSELGFLVEELADAPGPRDNSRLFHISVVAPTPAVHPLTPMQRTVKRAVDVLGAVVLLLVSAPLVLLAAVAVKLTSPGPILYTQIRTGAAPPRSAAGLRLTQYRRGLDELRRVV